MVTVNSMHFLLSTIILQNHYDENKRELFYEVVGIDFLDSNHR